MKIDPITPIRPLPTRLPPKPSFDMKVVGYPAYGGKPVELHGPFVASPDTYSPCNWPEKLVADTKAIIENRRAREQADANAGQFPTDASDTESGRLFAWTMLGLFAIFFMGCAAIGFIQVCRWIVVAL